MKSSRRPLALVTNDDGVGCRFLHELVAALTPHMRVIVAAPAGERSWIGRAFSRNRDVPVTETVVPGAEKAWSVDGTPSDCVNIALGHLLAGERPDLVLSGINVGYNVSMPLGLSSGTIAGAIEGAAWGIPAAAFSLDLEQADFERLRHADGAATGDVLVSLRHAAARAAGFARDLPAEPGDDGPVVHNYNFPRHCGADTPVEDAVPAELRFGSLYEQVVPGTFRFRWNDGENLSPTGSTDLETLARGAISHTVIDYTRLGRIPASAARDTTL